MNQVHTSFSKCLFTLNRLIVNPFINMKLTKKCSKVIGGWGRNGSRESLSRTESTNRNSIIPQKIRVAQKKSFRKKMSARTIPIYPRNLATFEESWILGSRLGACAPKRDMMWYENLRPSLFSAHWAYLMPRWPILTEGGEGGLHILTWKTTKNFFVVGKNCAERI